MSKVGVELRIDVSKIDKTRLYCGEKGTYLTATVFVDLDEKDQYGNSGMITEKVSKEEQQQGHRGNILGNCKVFWSESIGQPQQSNQRQHQAPQQAPQQRQQPQGNYQPQQGMNNANNMGDGWDDDQIPF